MRVIALIASLALAGCQTVSLTKEYVSKDQVQQACQLAMLAYGGWELAGNPGVKDQPTLTKIRVAYAQIEKACLAAPTTPLEQLQTVYSAVSAFRAQMALAKAGS